VNIASISASVWPFLKLLQDTHELILHMVQPKHRHIKMQQEKINCWMEASSRKTPASETKVSSYEYLGQKHPSHQEFTFTGVNFPGPRKWDSYPLRSCRSSSKFNLPPPCRRHSEMSSTLFFFSFSLTKALW
jgi:hypothetical protein